MKMTWVDRHIDGKHGFLFLNFPEQEGWMLAVVLTNDTASPSALNILPSQTSGNSDFDDLKSSTPEFH